MLPRLAMMQGHVRACKVAASSHRRRSRAQLRYHLDVPNNEQRPTDNPAAQRIPNMKGSLKKKRAKDILVPYFSDREPENTGFL